jgi:hypothetical protein
MAADRDLDGKWNMRALKGVRNAEDARVAVAKMEARVAEGKPALPQAGPEAVVGPLMERWRDGLKNRNARDDKSLVTRYLLPTFRAMTIEQAQRFQQRRARSASGAPRAATSRSRWRRARASTGCCPTPSTRRNELDMVLTQLPAAAPYPPQPVVRPAWNDTVLIKRLLDIGGDRDVILEGGLLGRSRTRPAAWRRWPGGWLTFCGESPPWRGIARRGLVTGPSSRSRPPGPWSRRRRR